MRVEVVDWRRGNTCQLWAKVLQLVEGRNREEYLSLWKSRRAVPWRTAVLIGARAHRQATRFDVVQFKCKASSTSTGNRRRRKRTYFFGNQRMHSHDFATE